MGGNLAKFATYEEKHVRALKLGIDSGMTLIDTAEEYGNGRAEEIVGRVVKGMRDKVFIATKFSPQHNSYNNVLKSAEDSLVRLQTDYIDLYQVHWPNPEIPIEETMSAMERLLSQGKVRHIGVCNLSLNEIKEAQTALTSAEIVSVQLEYNLFDRSIERNVLPYCEQKSITTIAYSPLDQGEITSDDKKLHTLQSIATKYDKTIAQLTLKWLITHPTVVAIPRAASEKHVLENSSASDFELIEEDFKEIDAIFKQECIYVPTDKIRVFAGGGKSPDVIQTIDDVISNKIEFAPNPLILAKHFRKGEDIKPVRLLHSSDKSGKLDYDLVEGRLRYWAWVIAHEGKVPIPAYIRKNSST